MPVERIRYRSFDIYDKKEIELIGKYDKRYKVAEDLQNGFNFPFDVDPKIYDKIYKQCKKWNMFRMKTYCKNRPINEVKVIFEYCKKYEIPMGTWDEIEEMMLEEHPLGWRKKPASEDWKYKQFIDCFID